MIDLSCFERSLSPLQKDLLEELEQKGPLTRSQLVEFTERPRTTIYDNLMVLHSYGLIKKFCQPRNTRGRPLVFFNIRKEVLH